MVARGRRLSGAPVVVLMGGPDAERAVSIDSGNAVAGALERGGYAVERVVIDRPGVEELRELIGAGALEGGVVFPALHGPFGEGGVLQRMLEEIGAVFVGSGAAASRVAIDKLATKQAAAALAGTAGVWSGCVGVSPTWVVDGGLDASPVGALPLVLKPNFEGSTVGLHLCRTGAQWRAGVEEARAGGRATIAEPLIDGIELTVGVLERGGRLGALPMIAIEPAEGVYDFAAKYERDDTAYRFGVGAPGLDEGALAAFSLALCERIGVRHLARADFMHDPTSGVSWFLEVNTMPGFTGHSLVPMAAARVGVDFDALCGGLVASAAGGAGSERGVCAERGGA